MYDNFLLYICIFFSGISSELPSQISDQLPITVEQLDLGQTEEDFEILRSPDMKISSVFTSTGQDYENSNREMALRRIPDLTKFLAKILALLSAKEDWCTLQQMCSPEKLPFVEWDWEQYQEPYKFDSSKMKTDMIAAGLYKRCGSMEFMPVYVNGDGNCMYNSISVILTGEEYLSLELRTSTTIAMIRHQESIKADAYSKGLHLAFQIDYQKDVCNAATQGCFQQTMNFVGMCWAINSSCMLLYPQVHGLDNINSIINHGLFASVLPFKGFHVMWSGDCEDEYGWNHFVPLLMADNW